MPADSGRQTEGPRGAPGDKPIDQRYRHREEVDLSTHSLCQCTQDDRLKEIEERQEMSLSTRDINTERRWTYHTHDAMRTQDDRPKGIEERQETSLTTRDINTERRWTYHTHDASVLRTTD